MSLKTEMEIQGQWLFRWRSFLPLLCLPVAVGAIFNSSWPTGHEVFHELWKASCLIVSLAGLGVRILTVGFVPDGTSGRNAKNQIATSLNTSGLYSVVRHPLYLGNFLIGLGAILAPFEWWLPLLYAATYCLYYERIMCAEESFLNLRFGENFAIWATVTPAFVPKLSLWRAPDRAFSWRMVLKREYTGLAVVALLHTAIELVQHCVIDKQFNLERPWAVLSGISFAVYAVLRSLKKHTHLFSDPESRNSEAQLTEINGEAAALQCLGNSPANRWIGPVNS